MSQPREECPAIGNKCPSCVKIAQLAYSNVLQEAGINKRYADSVVENGRVESCVENPLDGELKKPFEQACKKRQQRAEKIGTNLGEKFLERKTL